MYERVHVYERVYQRVLSVLQETQSSLESGDFSKEYSSINDKKNMIKHQLGPFHNFA